MSEVRRQGETPGVWFPAIRAGSGADVWTETLVAGLQDRGVRAEIAWLPHRAEYAPWTASIPPAPEWADVVHVNSWLPARFMSQRLPAVVTVHHCVHDPALSPYKSPAQEVYHRSWIRRVEASAIRRARIVTAVSAYTAVHTAALFGRDDMRMIHNGLDTHGAFVPSSTRDPRVPFRLLYVGKWSRRKGVDLLAPIMRQLGERFELQFTGDPAHALYSNMHALERLTDVAALVRAYQQADALLLPSRLEGFGLVALEAMACGLPVIASRGSALVEVVDDMRSGLLCEVDAVDAFAAAARRLAADHQLWQAMRKGARQRVLDHFSRDRMIDAYLTVYRDALLPPS